MYAMYYVAIGSLAALAFAACMFFRVKKEPEAAKRCWVSPARYRKVLMRI